MSICEEKQDRKHDFYDSEWRMVNDQERQNS